MKESIEKRVAETILQAPLEVEIGQKKYSIAPPSIATLILVSEAVARMPQLQLSDKRVMEDSLAVAKDCRVIGEIAAILILGAKQVNDTIVTYHTRRKSHLWGLYHTETAERKEESHKDKLAQELLEDTTPRELHHIIAKVLLKMEIGDFFGLTTFLCGINLTKQTKVETEPTASGQ